MAQITLGNGYDQSKSALSVTTDGGDGLVVNAGDRHDQSTQEVVVNHMTLHAMPLLDNEAKQTCAKPLTNHPRATRIWALGSFVVVSFILVVAVLAVVAHGLSPIVLPMVLIVSLLVLYLVTLFLVPQDNAKGVIGFQKVLIEYLSILRGVSRQPDDEEAPRSGGA